MKNYQFLYKSMSPFSRKKVYGGKCATMAGLCGLVIDTVLIVVGEFLTCCDIPDRHNPDGVAKLFRVTVWVTCMIDIACRVLVCAPINGITLIQSEDID